MIEQIISISNLTWASHHVIRNKGSAGVDGMPITGLQNYLRNNREQLAQEITCGDYLSQAINGVEIFKSNGKTRLVDVPAVIDRLLQQATSQAITSRFEFEFKEYSYGFRPNHNAQQAVLQAQKNIHEGYQYIVDIDLKNFFDEVDHCLLL